MSQVEVVFQPGLNVITGETGVGKSLLLDAVSSLLGTRRNSLPIRAGSDKAVIEAELDAADNEHLLTWLQERDLPNDMPIILRREFHTNGRTRFFVNDSPANLVLAKELGNLLIEIHGQHEIITLFDRSRQLDLLDAFNERGDLLESYKTLFGRLNDEREKFAKLKERIEDADAGRDVLERQLRELEEIDPKPTEIESIESELTILENSEKIYTLCAEICDRLNEAPESSVEHLTKVTELLPQLYPFNETLKVWQEDLSNAHSVLVELNRTLQEFSLNAKYDPERVEELRLRISTLTGFQKRWHCEDRDPCDIIDELRSRLEAIYKINATADELEVAIEKLDQELMSCGTRLSEARQKGAKRLTKLVHQKLTFIGMEKARFRIAFDVPNTDKPHPNGLDRVEFQLSPDGKLDFQTLNKVASGGEMSRILLALKSSLAEIDNVDTLIFDEIDQGISGRVARMVGQQLFELARKHQVIVVTHLAQIASLGDLHLSVRSLGDDGAAEVFTLEDEERVEELAALLTATGISNGALLNAREMVESAKKHRAEL
jgi:DNA repair protein RecN (Recombination protein N)